MKEEHYKVMREFSHRVRERYPSARIWIFGSYVRGSETSESDCDLCVVLPQCDTNDRFIISDIAWELGLSRGLFLSTIVVTADNFDEGPFSSSPIADSIRTEGVSV